MIRRFAITAPLALAGCKDGGGNHAAWTFAGGVAAFIVIGLVLTIVLHRRERREDDHFTEPPGVEDDVPM